MSKKKQHHNQANELRNSFHSIGVNCKFENCDFGKDLKLISIGSNVQIREGVKFINYRPAAEHFDKVFSGGSNPMLRDLGPIVIEDNVFIGSNVLLLPNITIGKNSLILDGSVIFESIPENSVVCGNPGKVIDTISNWYNRILTTNESYPWYGKELSHDKIVEEREKFFFEGIGNEFKKTFKS